MTDYEGGEATAGDMTSDRGAAAVREALLRSGALRQGHFLLTSGRHSDRFFLLPQLFQYPALAAPLAAELACCLRRWGAAVVAGPAVGGIILSYEVARHLGARAVFAEKVGQPLPGGHARMELRRGFTLKPGEAVVVVEDVLTTGGSVRAAMAAVTQAGGRVVGVGTLVDRSAGRAQLGVPLTSLWQVEAADWAADACPLCARGIALEQPKR